MVKSIGITGIFRQDQLAGGPHSFFANLTRGFSELVAASNHNPDFDVTVFHSPSEPVPQNGHLHWHQVSDRFGRFAAESRVALNDGGRFDALLFTNYHTPLVVRARRAVTIIHDLQYFHMPEFIPPSKRLWLRFCHAVTLRKCHRVVAISNAVKEDMLRLYGRRWEDRIEVIWNPIAMDRFEPAVSHDITSGRPYILCVAVDRPPKNLFRLVEAFAKVRIKHPDYCLVLAGQLRASRRDMRERSDAFRRSMPAASDLVDGLQLSEHVRVTGFISDQELGALYRSATLCVLPSLFEGFGMPAAESLAMGKPTLVSGLPVLREITFDSANYIEDPRNVDAIADAISGILDAPDRYRPPAELTQRVREVFAPRHVAQRYLHVLTT